MPEENYIQQLASYILKNLSKGYTLDSLRIALERQDYSKLSIERAVELANKHLAKKAPPMKEKPVIRYQVVPSLDSEKSGFFKRLKKLFYK